MLQNKYVRVFLYFSLANNEKTSDRGILVSCTIEISYLQWKKIPTANCFSEKS